MGKVLLLTLLLSLFSFESEATSPRLIQRQTSEAHNQEIPSQRPEAAPEDLNIVDELSKLKALGVTDFPLIDFGKESPPGLLNLIENALPNWVFNNIRREPGRRIGLTSAGPQVFEYEATIPLDTLLSALQAEGKNIRNKGAKEGELSQGLTTQEIKEISLFLPKKPEFFSSWTWWKTRYDPWYPQPQGAENFDILDVSKKDSKFFENTNRFLLLYPLSHSNLQEPAWWKAAKELPSSATNPLLSQVNLSDSDKRRVAWVHRPFSQNSARHIAHNMKAYENMAQEKVSDATAGIDFYNEIANSKLGKALLEMGHWPLEEIVQFIQSLSQQKIYPDNIGFFLSRIPFKDFAELARKIPLKGDNAAAQKGLADILNRCGPALTELDKLGFSSKQLLELVTHSNQRPLGEKVFTAFEGEQGMVDNILRALPDFDREIIRNYLSARINNKATRDELLGSANRWMGISTKRNDFGNEIKPVEPQKAALFRQSQAELSAPFEEMARLINEGRDHDAARIALALSQKQGNTFNLPLRFKFPVEGTGLKDLPNGTVLPLGNTLDSAAAALRDFHKAGFKSKYYPSAEGLHNTFVPNPNTPIDSHLLVKPAASQRFGTPRDYDNFVGKTQFTWKPSTALSYPEVNGEKVFLKGKRNHPEERQLLERGIRRVPITPTNSPNKILVGRPQTAPRVIPIPTPRARSSFPGNVVPENSRFFQSNAPVQTGPGGILTYPDTFFSPWAD